MNQNLGILRKGSTLLSPEINGVRLKLFVHEIFKEAGVAVLRIELPFAKHNPTFTATLKELNDNDYKLVDDE